MANKLVAMVLHKLSQECPAPYTVRSHTYRETVHEFFLNHCPFCGDPLRPNATIVEHLDALNPFRAGLHVPGNVLPACKACNSKKRRDDQAKVLRLADSGWASFLSHDGTRCQADCKNCAYWREKWPDDQERQAFLRQQRERIAAFRSQHLPPMAPVLSVRVARELRTFYTEVQGLAVKLADELTARVLENIEAP